MMTRLADGFTSLLAHFRGSIVSFDNVDVGTRFPNMTCISGCQATSEAHT